MSEEYKDKDKGQTIWAPRPSDPELESEFLNRLMVKLGVSAEKAQVAVNASKDLGSGIVPKTALESRSDGQVIVMRETYDVAWRRVGVTLDRTGFTVEDRDRSRGIYFVRYVDIPKQEDKGFFKNLFSSTPQPKGPAKYRIVVNAQRNVSEVRVQNEAGQPENSEVTQRIYKLLADSLQ
jgi:outer membrane protein assembly factor BamC